MNGHLIFGLNIHKEICALQMIGGVSILPEEVSFLSEYRNLLSMLLLIGFDVAASCMSCHVHLRPVKIKTKQVQKQ